MPNQSSLGTLIRLCPQRPGRRRLGRGGPWSWRSGIGRNRLALTPPSVSSCASRPPPSGATSSTNGGTGVRCFSSRLLVRTKIAETSGEVGDGASSSSWDGKQPFGRRLADGGPPLSHFIAKAAAASRPHVRVEQTKNDTHPNNFSAAEQLPAQAEIGIEFDDEVLTPEAEGADLMVTDAMSCRTSINGNDGATSGALGRLGRQMVFGEEEEEEEEENAPRMTRFHIKTYGCQMNVNDTDIVRSILLNNHKLDASTATGPGHDGENVPARSVSPLRFVETDDEVEADLLLTNTCAIRENAEQKVWHRLRALRSHDRNFPLPTPSSRNDQTSHNGELDEGKDGRRRRREARRGPRRIIGVLGCMAERLKEDMFRDGTADLVVGPDAYRDLPRLVSVLAAPSVAPADEKNGGAAALPTERAVNVQLSLDETYASVSPVRSNPEDVSAFVSVMRGCNNMCSYCVVPFTRGRERSRDMDSIVEETRRLLEEEGIKEVVLLGQNVNSYHDMSGERRRGRSSVGGGKEGIGYRMSNDGFSNLFRLRHGNGHRFADLLDAVSSLSPELRVRFTSPHPKDYPPDLLCLMAERSNICSHLHMPAQSGSSAVLRRMRRGYGREAYLELIDDVRAAIPDVAISSDFISGFCGETDEEHQETLLLMEEVKYDQAFMFAYSMRGKTHAHRTMVDDVPLEVKKRRLNEVIGCFRRNVQIRNDETEVGSIRLVLVEGEARRSSPGNVVLSGRTDQNKRVVFPSERVPTEEEAHPFVSDILGSKTPGAYRGGFSEEDLPQKRAELFRGDYAAVLITEARGHTLRGQALWRSSVVGFQRLSDVHGWKDATGELVGKAFAYEAGQTSEMPQSMVL